MSVRFTFVTQLVRNVSRRLPSSCRKSSARRASPPAKREPNTASACSSTKTFTMRRRSFGWYSRSASWMTEISHVGLGEGGADRHALAAVRDVLEEDPLDLARPPVAAEPHALVERPVLLPRNPALPGEPLQHPGGPSFEQSFTTMTCTRSRCGEVSRTWSRASEVATRCCSL